MSRHWKEKLDVNKHGNWIYSGAGIHSIEVPKDNLIEHWVYFIYVCSFTFEFASLDQIYMYLEHFKKKHHESSIQEGVYEHYWQLWNERLPRRLFAERNRHEVIKAFEKALDEFESR